MIRALLKTSKLVFQLGKVKQVCLCYIQLGLALYTSRGGGQPVHILLRSGICIYTTLRLYILLNLYLPTIAIPSWLCIFFAVWVSTLGHSVWCNLCLVELRLFCGFRLISGVALWPTFYCGDDSALILHVFCLETLRVHNSASC